MLKSVEKYLGKQETRKLDGAGNNDK